MVIMQIAKNVLSNPQVRSFLNQSAVVIAEQTRDWALQKAFQYGNRRIRNAEKIQNNDTRQGTTKNVQQSSSKQFTGNISAPNYYGANRRRRPNYWKRRRFRGRRYRR